MNNPLKEKYLLPFLESQDTQLSPSTIYSKQLYVGQLLEFLEEKSIETLEDFDINLVYDFMNTRREWAPTTVSGAQFQIRSFFDFLFSQGITRFDGRKVFPVILTNKRDRIISFYETEEIKAIVDVIDLHKHNGVRNKCVILLAAQLGLRSGDIYGLKLSDIKWDKNLIERRQAKTGNWISLPLPLNLKLLLADYIQNYRPEHHSDFVFISDQTLKPLTVEIVQFIVANFSKKANIERRGRKMGPHALRHSLATRLLKGNYWLNRYTEERGKASDVYFFQSANGQHRDTQSVRTVFITKILPAAGINPNRGGVNVRVHDLRHTFACHVLNKLVQKGADPFCALPYLSVYMGHKDIKSTELYLRLTEDRFKEITDAGHCIYEGLGDWDD